MVMAGDCKVVMHDEKGDVSGNLTIKNGKHVDIGSNTRLNCKDGNVTVTETNPTKRVVKRPELVIGPEGLRLKER